jgi:hypothetical protein
MTLVQSWLDTELIPGRTKADALRDLNRVLGTRYQSNRLYEWISGARSIPDPVRDYMMRIAIEMVLYRNGVPALSLSDAQAERIVDELR